VVAKDSTQANHGPSPRMPEQHKPVFGDGPSAISMGPGEGRARQVIAMGSCNAKPSGNPQTHWLNMP